MCQFVSEKVKYGRSNKRVDSFNIIIFDHASDNSPRLFCVDPPIVDLATKSSEATSTKDGLTVKVGKRYAGEDNDDDEDDNDGDDDDDDHDAFLKIVHGNLRLIYDPRREKSDGKIDLNSSNGEPRTTNGALNLLISFSPFLVAIYSARRTAG